MPELGTASEMKCSHFRHIFENQDSYSYLELANSEMRRGIMSSKLWTRLLSSKPKVKSHQNWQTALWDTREETKIAGTWMQKYT